MPIVNVSESSIVQQCTECANTAEVSRASLVLGVVNDTASDPNLIALPPCKCGAQEFLNRTFDTAPDQLAAHRKKVNALAIDLRTRGQVHEGLKDRIHAERHAPTQVGELLGPVVQPATAEQPANPALAMLALLRTLPRVRPAIDPSAPRTGKRADHA